MKVVLHTKKSGDEGFGPPMAMTFDQLPRVGEHVWLKEGAICQVTFVIHLEYKRDAEAEVYAVEVAHSLNELFRTQAPNAPARLEQR